ncbi:MAG: NTP transferase domain-containing protein [Cytophagales bacterium]|nr:NTP transferase domain-containing protein [Cytophagales bacterium]
MSDIHGLLLCGTQLSRLNYDRGLAKHRGKTWAEISHQKLSKFCKNTFVSVTGSQVANYSHIFGSNNTIKDSVQIKGPLAGLLSAHLAHPDYDFLVLACDQLDIKIDTLELLLRKYNYSNESDVIMYQHLGKPQPLPGIYTSNLLRDILQRYRKATDRTDMSLHSSIKNASICSFHLPEAKVSEFKTILRHH